MKKVALASLLVVGTLGVAWGANPRAAEQLLRNALRHIVELEPDREGPLHDTMRGAGALVNTPNPAVRFVMPADGEEFPGFLAVEIDNWEVDPSKATNGAREFVIGYQERGIGHTHVWVFRNPSLPNDAPVRFTGANGLLLDPVSGLYMSQPFTLPPGEYKAFVQLQNHDHAGALPASAPSFPGVDSVIFTVPGAPGGGGGENPPHEH